jgi:hypothetical protein
MEYSPILAVATAGFEIAVAGWALTLVRAKERGRRVVSLTTGTILLLLAGYQLTEVAICADVGAAGFLPRFAFIIVTWLPALGLLLIAFLHRPRSRFLYGSAWAMLAVSAAIVAWIALDRSFASASVCNAVYARYAHAQPRFQFYAFYYWAGLLGMIVLSGYAIRRSEDPRRRRLLAHVEMGTLGFVLPSLVLSYFVPAMQDALPSILCHFALFLAVALTRMLWVMREGLAEERAELTESSAETRI